MAVALLATTIYAVVYSLIEWGSLGTVYLFLSSAAPAVLSSPFASYGSFEIWFNHAPFGGGWAIAIPLLALLALTALLASRTSIGAGGRLALGGLVGVCLVVFTVLLTVLNYLLTLADDGYYYGRLGETLLRAGGGAAIVGFAGGLLGALLSLAIRPPRGTRRL